MTARTQQVSPAQVYEVVRPIPGLPAILPGDHVVVYHGEHRAHLHRDLRFEVVLGATEGPRAVLRPLPPLTPESWISMARKHLIVAEQMLTDQGGSEGRSRADSPVPADGPSRLQLLS